MKEWWEKTDKAPIGVEWADTDKDDAESPEYRCRSVAKEIKRDKREDAVCGHAAARNQEGSVLVAGQHGRSVSGFHRCCKGLLLCTSEKRSARGAVKGG